MELLVIVASIFRRYHFVLENPDAAVGYFPCIFGGSSHADFLVQLETREGFLRKPVDCKVGMKRRFV